MSMPRPASRPRPGRALLALAALLLTVFLPAAAAGAAPAAAGAELGYLCDGDPLVATVRNGAVDAEGIPNTSQGTVPGAFVTLRWRDLHLQLPRTNNAGPPSYTDGRWWWSLEDPDHPRFLLRRGAVRQIPCQPAP